MVIILDGAKRRKSKQLINMKYPINTSLINKKLEFYEEVVTQKTKAESYLQSFDWCGAIIDSELYSNLGKILCIFLFEIINNQRKEDNYVWVVVGDVPSMYLDIYGPKSTHEVLENYVSLSRDWIYGVENNLNMTDFYPFKEPKSLELARMLRSRTDRIENSVIPNIEDVSLPEPLSSL
ncbi:hypothetical protein EZ449_22140 [Pedobacter frigidisoli]|uniref:Uncharacterized protein n=1 Tax=Pedobacter frigidisoli TaxID=2530455 RepID=A0A4R0NE14_9SPHI|nr:hypothetical protein [Pedobacter frigidisoli]TCC96774.1 hypothetical protein EZ449_22140 [Pedobacter frigidisoli]